MIILKHFLDTKEPNVLKTPDVSDHIKFYQIRIIQMETLLKNWEKLGVWKLVDTFYQLNIGGENKDKETLV